mmetsp:Transcript_23853/g.34986  ORF Transcript_23853/g.34986 Transcript_23853/m.34986 type:complete len:558 (+) Transcript_23853:42-1715(+)
MVAKKRKSKRQTLQQKYKIQKRVKDHKKKVKKGIIVGTRKTKKNDNHIPNDWPYKAELLQEIQAAKEKMELVKQRQKEKRSELMMKKRMENSSVPMKNVLSEPVTEFVEESSDDEMDIKGQSLGQNSRRAFLRELRKIVDSADVILHVLDARDPVGTRSTAIEEMVLSNAGKKLVYVVNKADLIPRNVLVGWLAYLRQFHPAIPFKCNTQNQKGNLGRGAGKVGRVDESALLSPQAIGAEELIGLMKNYCRVGGGQTKSSISVGIVGFPNVGKSSLINSLTRTRSVNVSSTPGFTKKVQEVILDKNIRLLDSPGVVFADGDAGTTVLRNCVNVEEMDDVITPVQAILERCPAPYLMQVYSIPRFNATDCMGFLALVARATGKLKKGGVPHIEAAAKGVLHDWNNGKIKYYCKPPDMSSKSSATQVHAEEARGDTRILSAFSDQLDLDNMQETDVRVLEALDAVDDVAFVPVEAAEFVTGEPNDGDEEMASDAEGSDCEGSVATTSTKKTSSRKPAASLSLRSQQKKDKKKSAKNARRSQQVNAENLEDYDFETDFQY